MSRKKEIEAELELAIEEVRKWGLAKIKKYTEKDLAQEAHLMGIDIVHDACHTLRGRLPKTEKVDLPAMKKLWGNSK